MKLKINKASDLSSISVLPPQARRSNGSSNAIGQKNSQLRSQSQQSMSQGISSQHGGAFSQLSQNSLDEALTNDQRFFSQERENTAKKPLCLPMTAHSREESQMPISRSSTNLMRKWSSSSLPDHKCQVSEELEHRIGLIETSLNRFGMILNSVQSDVMQVNKGTKEVSMEAEAIRQKLAVQDNSLQLLIKGQDDIKASLDGGFKTMSEQVNKNAKADKLQEVFSVLLALPEKIQGSIQKSQNELRNTFMKEIQAKAFSPSIIDEKEQVLPIPPSRVTRSSAALREKPQPRMNSQVPPNVYVQRPVVPKIETGGWKTVKAEKTGPININMASSGTHKQKGSSSVQKDLRYRIIIDSDEESDEGFSCLLKGNKTGLGNFMVKEVKEETERIMRKARRRKRQCRNTIIIN